MAPRRPLGPNRYGVGTYAPTADGRHRWRVTTTLATGQPKRIEIRKATLDELDIAVDAWIATERTLGHAPTADTQTLLAYLNEWLATVVDQPGKQPTLLKYRHDLQRLMPYLKRHRLGALRAQHIQAALRAMQHERADDGSPRYAPSTIRRSFEVLRNALNRAVVQGRIARNPCMGVEAPDSEPYEAYALSVDEARRLRQAARGDRLEVLYEVMLIYGFRRGEVLGLRWQDIDFQRRTIRVAQQVIAPAGRVVISERTKTKGSKATLPLVPELAPRLREQQQRIDELRDSAKRWTEYDLVFPSSVGTPIAPRNLIRSYKKLLKQAGLPERIRFQDLRHSVASFLAAANVHPAVAQQILRHADVRTTMAIYTHVTLDQQAEAAQTLRRLTRLTDEDQGVA